MLRCIGDFGERKKGLRQDRDHKDHRDHRVSLMIYQDISMNLMIHL